MMRVVRTAVALSLGAFLILSASIQPAWGADRGRIAFVGTRRNPSAFPLGHIYTERIDGSGLTRVTAARNAYSSPAWSPDGSELAYGVSGLGPRLPITIINADGSDPRVLVGGENNYTPAWSPDGTEVAFSRSTNCPGRCGLAIFTIGTDGEGLARITGPRYGAFEPTWSSSGRRIAFDGAGPDGFYLDAINVDGSGLDHLTTSRVDLESPSWSPTGPAILFLHATRRIEILRPRTGNIHTVLHCAGLCRYVRDPAWSPNGSRIVFVEGRGRRGERPSLHLMMMRTDGSHEQRIRTHDLSPSAPAWQP
jgi:Tol biopolymer transport system component